MSDDTLPYRLDGRCYDELGRLVPRNPLAGKPGFTWLLGLGMAQQFRARVPSPQNALGPWVRCRCGALSALDVGEVAQCPGHCGRWFLRTEKTMRWAQWEDT